MLPTRMQPEFRRSPVAVAVAAVLAGAPVAPLAAQEGPDGALTLEEVVVTATRREQTVLEVPYNISAVSGDALESRQIIDNADLMRAVTGVSVVDRGYRNSGVINGIMIRGVNSDGSAFGDYQLSTVPTVSTYLNDTPVYANFLLKDIERVEVLRGPQGTLYGSGSLGGTVRYITRAPRLNQFEGSVSGTVSQVNGSSDVGYGVDAMFNVPLGETAALRITGTRLDYPGLTDYVNVYRLDSDGIPVAPNGVLDPAAEYYVKKDADTAEIWYGRAALLWKPTDAVDVTLSYTHQSDDIGGRRQETVGFDGYGRAYREYENGSIQLEPSSRDVDVAALEVNVDFGFATLTSSSSWYDHEGDSVSENTGFYAQAGFLGFYYNYPRPMASAVRSYDDSAFVQELRLVSNGEGRLDWTIGAFYQDQDMGQTQQSFLPGFKRWWDVWSGLPAVVTGDQDFDYSRKENFKDRSVFGELTWKFTDRLQATAGFRYYDHEFTNHSFMDLPLYAGAFTPTNSSFDTSDDGVLWKGNVSYKFGVRNLVYATISEGYRRGGSNAVPTSGTFAEDPGFLRFGPDSTTNYEIGVKGIAGRFQYSAAAFFVDWDDVQINTSTPNWGFFAAVNGGKASSKGVELELDGRITDRLGLNLGYAYVDAKLDEDAVSPTGFVLGSDGNRLPGTPEHSIMAGLVYTMPVGADRSWISRVNGYYQSRTQNAISDSPTFNVPLAGFQLWNLSTTLAADRWDATLWAKNIFNEEGVTGLFTEAYMGTAPALGYYGNGSKQFISLPRTFGVTVSYRF
ncbi:MAG: hypothetical protein AMXMBFR37_04970 [Steroidobacteraceae bacterium]